MYTLESHAPPSRSLYGTHNRYKKHCEHENDSVEEAFKNNECNVSPAHFTHETFVLLYSLIEGCHEVNRLHVCRRGRVVG